MAAAPSPSAAAAYRSAPQALVGRLWPLLVMLLLAASLRLAPTELFRPLDRTLAVGRVTQVVGSIEHPDVALQDSFPGAAYFLAEDAFPALPSPVPQGTAGPVTALDPDAASPHILLMERGPAALSLPLRAATPLDRLRALQCLTSALYYEAGNEPEEGQRAVAQVILNRVASANWPDSVCGVIYQGGERADRGCQFTFSCDGSMARRAVADKWNAAMRVAQRALAGEIFAPVGLATFYHTLAVHPPWADRMRPVAVVGAHIFYRLPGPAGEPSAYRPRYTGREYAQPGPYAFVPPPRPVVLPAGPQADWLASAAPLPVAEPRPFPTVPEALSFAPGLQPPPSASPRTAPAESRLPQSAIRPEYRNSGRPLH